MKIQLINPVNGKRTINPVGIHANTRSAKSMVWTAGECGGSWKGERQTAIMSAAQEPGYLFICYPLSSPSPNLSLFPAFFFFF